MESWRSGSKCPDCKAGKVIDNTMAKYAPGQPRDNVGRWADSTAHLSMTHVDREGPVTGPDGRPVQPERPDALAGYDHPVTRRHLPSSERHGYDSLPEGQKSSYLRLRSLGRSHRAALDALSANSLSKETTPMTAPVSKYAPGQPRDEHGRWTDGGASGDYDDEGFNADGSEFRDMDGTVWSGGPSAFHGRTVSGNRVSQVTTHANLREFAGHLRSVDYSPPRSRTKKEASLMFKCSSCATPMNHWRDGSECRNCMVQKAAAKPAANAAKKPAGNGSAPNVQSEFPSCPSCGEPSKDGRKCEDCRKGTDREHEQGDLTTAQMRAQAERDQADSEEESERRDLRAKVRAAMARMLGLDDLAKAAVRAADLPPMVLKASNQARFSFAPMYMPGKIDAHDEFVKSGDELQKAAWDYVRKTGADRTVYLQHIDQPAGEWVEITSWPYPVEAMMTHPGTGQVRKAVLPANTVYMGVIWKPWAWELVQKGRLMGFSMGGWAKRVQAELADESVTKSARGKKHPGADEPWDQAGIVNPQHPAARSIGR